MPSVKLDVWDGDVLAGVAYCDPAGDDMSVAFTYDPSYLSSPHARPIDPAFPLYEGGFQVNTTPGSFRDAAPDSWGRSLIRQKMVADRVGRTPDEIDYLLGASDVTRQGSLRFSLDGDFLAQGAVVPSILEIHDVARLVHDAGSDADAVMALLRGGAGSSGGAVPKAAIVDEAGGLWLAKFYADSDTGLWEQVAAIMAARLGLLVPETRLIKAGDGLAFLSKRFDRAGRARVPYASAATLAQLRREEAGDYTHILWALEDHGKAPRDDARELWRRMVFMVAVNSTDDHFGNHGFLWDGSGWRLAPMFDVVPSDKLARKTSIAGRTMRADMLDALMESAGEFGISSDDARHTIGDTWTATRDWAAVGARLGASSSSVASAESAFDELRAAAEVVAS